MFIGTTTTPLVNVTFKDVQLGSKGNTYFEWCFVSFSNGGRPPSRPRERAASASRTAPRTAARYSPRPDARRQGYAGPKPNLDKLRGHVFGSVS